MSDVTFVDTNVLIYAHDVDAGPKREAAIDGLRRLWVEDSGALSVQVLQEFYVNVTRKLASPLARATAREVVQSYGLWVRQPTSVATILRATDLAEMAQLSFWDALIVAAAEQAGATELLSEDLNAGQTIAGILIVNPFLGASNRGFT